MKKIWITGCQGMLAQAVIKLLQQAQIPWVGSDRRLSISQEGALEAFYLQHKPSHLINCAAYTQVDQAEDEPQKAEQTNHFGPHALAKVALRHQLIFAHVSTDYVFDGKAEKPYHETDNTRPIGVYGQSKRRGEEAVLKIFEPSTQPHYIVRTSWLFGHGGKNFINTMLRLFKERPHLKIVADQWGCPTYCSDLAQAILQLMGLFATAKNKIPATAEHGIYHCCNQGITNWHAFAHKAWQIAQQHALQPMACQNIEAIATKDYPTKAQRPQYSALDCSRLQDALGQSTRPWQKALEDYISQELQGT